MNRDPPPPSIRRTGVSHMSNATRGQDDFPTNCRPTRQQFQQQNNKPQFSYNHCRDRPPGPPPDSVTKSFSPNFSIVLEAGPSGFKRWEIEGLKANLKVRPDRWESVFPGPVRFFYLQWVDVLETIAHLWEDRLNGVHVFLPRLEGKLLLPSDRDELTNRLKKLFVEYVKGLLGGQVVKNWEMKLRMLEEEIENLEAPRRRGPTGYALFYKIQEKVDMLASEKELVERRIKEFKWGMECIIGYLEGKVTVDWEVKAIKLDGDFDWGKLHCLILRECRRLDDGLPIYASRKYILRNIHSQQAIVLSGETGSGKSTQLVQFLADSGVAGNEAIICTQPRKLAAMSLTHRVKAECCGCYQDAAVTCTSTFSSVQESYSKIMFMTDHCLLQHYMSDNNLSRISCIIVDEAHERSLNTDLLLALLKKLLNQRADLRLIIMSATADTDQLANYFYGCGTLKVKGRNFPVDINYVPCISDGPFTKGLVASYVHDVLRMVTEIHRKEREGTILAFLTSQMEVEWACEQFQVVSAVALPLHGKLSHDDQFRVYLNYPGKRKVIFATNLAETSLTIPGVKYVVDSGVVKESKFEPGSGMNVLRVSTISQSSANQRAGRAGRTEPGKCYRLYGEEDFRLMPPHQEPEIRRVHLGVAVLRILALGIKNIEEFDFIDAPSSEAIEMAIRNLIQLGAVTLKSNVYELTKDGREMVKLGIEPRLGKIILKCFDQRLGKEGIILAAVMANSSSIFCRVGTDDDKQKSDCLKVKFCHPDGDLFTLLSVYKEWQGVPPSEKNQWCWNNSINAKSLRRCQETVHELERCLSDELKIIIPSYWCWNPKENTDKHRILKKVILSSLSENVAVYSGYDQLGYEVALTGRHVKLHPSCSLLNFGQRPSWVVFGEILALSNQYLVCVNAVDVESMDTLSPPPFDISQLDSRKLQVKVLTGLGSTLLKKFCGKSNSGLDHLVSRIRTDFVDDRIGIEVDVDRNEVQLFASTQDITEVSSRVMDALQHEKSWLQNECLEKCLYIGGRGVSPIALLGAGAEIKHLELDKRYLTVDACLSDANGIDDKEFLMFLERNVSGSICAVHKFPGTGQQDTDKIHKWGRITFLTPDAAETATKLSELEFMGAAVKLVPSRSTFGGDNKLSSFPSLKAKVSWPRRCSKGVAVVKCEVQDAPILVQELSDLQIGGRNVYCEQGRTMDSVVLLGLDKDLSEAEIFEALRSLTNRKILDFFLVRGNAVENPPCDACEAALVREIAPFMTRRNTQGSPFHVQVLPPEPKDSNMRGFITFDGSMHLEVAKALEQIEGKVLAGCLPWQKIKCQQLFHSSVSCPEHVYFVIKDQLHSLLTSLQRRKGAECYLEKNHNGSYRVKMSANATKTVAELRRPLENLMNGRTIYHAALTPTVLQLLFTRDAFGLLKRVQRETGTYILFDRNTLTLRVFGSSEKTNVAEQRLVQSLVTLHENKSKQLEVHLRSGVLPPDMMKKVVEIYGPDLSRLQEKFPGAEFTLNTRRHVIYIHGNKELKQKVEDEIYEIAQASGGPSQRSDNETACPICLCEVEDSYRLEACGHEFCASCLTEQLESAIRSQDTFPIRCAQGGCGALILITDLKSLLSSEKLEELFRASLGAYVASSGGKYRFCPSPDCPSIYQVAEPGTTGAPFVCGACSAETCTKCHVEYHPYLSCEKYREFKEDPDTSLKDWCKGKENVKHCPVCGFTIEKVDGCNHVECRCGKHICWGCLEFFTSSDDCYSHLRLVHLDLAIIEF